MTDSIREKSDQDVVVTVLGVVTSSGIGLDAIWEAAQVVKKGDRASHALPEFRAMPYLSDKRMMKAVSNGDALGLATIEILKKEARWGEIGVAPNSIGLYVGAPASPASANDFYLDAVRVAKAWSGMGAASPVKFGQAAMAAKPTALLIGLPNNVLCYAAMILDARGPNSNYTSSMTSGMTALMNGARRVCRGQLRVAVAGGFAFLNAGDVNERVYLHAGFDAHPFADGAAFATLERREQAVTRGMKPLATLHAFAASSDAGAVWALDDGGQALERAIGRALADSGVRPADIGLVLATDSARPGLEARGLTVLSRVFANARAQPAVGNFSRRFGDLMEGAGAIELAVAAKILETGKVPAGLISAAASAAGFGVDVPKAALALVIRQGFNGESVIAVVGKE